MADLNREHCENCAEAARFRRQAEHLREIYVQEKKLLGFDFHDGLVQNLVAAKMLVEQLGASETGHGEQIVLIGNLIGRAIAESRILLNGQFDLPRDQSIDSAVTEFVEQLKTVGNIPFEVSIDDSIRSLKMESDLKTNLYRIVQQSIYNAFFHADAETIRVSMTSDVDHILAVVEDDGRGFNAKAERVGIGLKSIQERAEMFGGEAKIESEKGAGTKIEISIPLKT